MASRSLAAAATLIAAGSFTVYSSSIASSLGATGLQISLAGDLLAEQALSSDSDAVERLSPRSFELMFYAPVDHHFNAVASATAHDERGELFFETHELWIGSSKIIPRGRFRIGQMFPAFGRLQRFHQHDWPFISAPEVHTRFFDDEGIIDTGAELSYLLPLPRFVELTVGVTSGWTFGHTHNEGTKPDIPTHYTRLSTSFGAGQLGDAEFGFNYVGRTSSENTETLTFGLDFVAKKREARTLKYLLQSETWYREETRDPGGKERSLGGYLYGQYGFNPRWQLGLRLDAFSVLSQQDALGRGEDNLNFAWVPTLTYRSSEFATFRIAYNDRRDTVDDRTIDRDRFLQFQATFILGAHPAHTF
ncbi:hypothetical protein AB833_02425 [Chromatiales bacterium (ex Bugula neritina AB1)]|nr:hypothetical protein AB833_02425 [Chromatiales bacterium (ex Bugula neritina AB1)]